MRMIVENHDVDIKIAYLSGTSTEEDCNLVYMPVVAWEIVGDEPKGDGKTQWTVKPIGLKAIKHPVVIVDMRSMTWWLDISSVLGQGEELLKMCLRMRESMSNESRRK